MITRDDWMQALNDATVGVVEPSDALTVTELMETWHTTRSTAKRLLEKMKASGAVTATTKRVRRSDGQIVPTRAYILNK